MSLRNRLFLPVIVTTLAFLAGCGSSSPKAVPPPSGGFSNSNLNGTYVFSVSGTDLNGAAYAIVGTLTANGSGGNGTGGITAGTIDINDESFSNAVADSSLGSGSSYTVGVDGRGKATLVTSTPFKTITLDFVLSSSTHGLVTEFDEAASGSGTIDQQAGGITQSSLAGSYAFSFSGVDAGGSGSFATVGAFALDASGNIASGSGLEDFNDNGLVPYSGQSLTGQVVLGPSSTPSAVLQATSFSLTYDVFAIDATHLKFIEMDPVSPILSGDAFSQTSTSISAGTMAFTLGGLIAGNPAGAGGFMVTDGQGNITSSSTEDVNDAGTVSSAPVPFSGTYAAAGTGRYMIGFPSGSNFIGGTSYAAYPSSGGLLLLEIDNAGLMIGAGYPQASTIPAFATPDGYGMNLTGFNLGAGSEVDDIAEFTAGSSGTLSSGIIDENYPGADPPLYDLALTNGTFGSIDSSGRYGISADAGTSSVTTLNGGFALTFYSVDGTTFPFIENDTGQVANGVMVLQSSSGAAATARSHIFIPRPLVRPHAAKSKKK
jgi:hypothetical protein